MFKRQKTLSVLFLFCLILAPLRAALTDGLILHYTFDNVTGTTVPDVSGNGKSGTLMGAASVGTGYSGSAASFTTVSDYMQLPNGLLTGLTNFSASAWVKVQSLNGWSRIFDFGSGMDYNMFLTPLSGANCLRFAIKNGGGEEQVNAPAALKSGEWVHVAVTYSWNVWGGNGIAKLYVNGMQVADNKAMSMNPSMLPVSTQNYLAKSQYPDPALNGMIDDFRLYNRTLTDSELLEINGYTTEMLNAYNSITINGNLTMVTSDLTLQTTAGTAAYPVTWTSSSPDVVSTTGVVKRPALFDQAVTLKASFSAVVNGKTVTMTKEFTVTVLANDTPHWESIVLETDTFSYLAATSEPASGWYLGSFNATSWKTGPGGFGFADNDDNTVIPSCNSVYLRRQFTVPDKTKIDKLVLDMDYDDAFVLYLNGVEVARSSNVTGALPAYNAALSIDHEAKMYAGGSPERFTLNAASLINGVNTLAVQVLNKGIGSTDLSARVFLHGRIRGAGILFHQTPSWFVDPINYESSNLPIILINTDGKTIQQNTKINVNMKVINKPGEINYVSDTTYEYNGMIGIEVRGFSSATFPKKSYTVETRTDTLSNLNVKLLGLPKENDWVFHGPYPDKTLMRNAVAYNIGNQTGRWSPRTRFFELYLNGNYQGAYTLVEKIKIDKHRCDLATLNPEDTVGDELTGGYVLKIDRPENTDVEGVDYWKSPYKAWTSLQQTVYFIHQDPKGNEMSPVQRKYIKDYVTSFENAMYSNNYGDKEKGYLPLIDFYSFIDYYIITELSRNLDGYRISTFIQKDKDSKGGKLTMGPFWDYDISYGNADFFSAGNPEGWIIDGMGNADAYAMPFWWQKFRLDPHFNAYLKVRWNEFTGRFLNTTYINHVIDSCANELIDAQKRNFQTWNILTTKVWPNPVVPGTYGGEINYLKTWISNRITWMNGQIQAITDLPDNLNESNYPMDLVTYPNPFTDRFAFKFELPQQSRIQILISDVYGRIAYRYDQEVGAGLQEIPVAVSELASSQPFYLYKVMVNGAVRKSGKLIRKF